MKHILRLALLALVLVPVASCDTDELHNRNINPQALQTVPMEFLFSAAELSSASGGAAGDNRYIDWRTNIGFCAYAIQQLANATLAGISPGDKYFDNVESYNAPWELIYGDQLKNLAEVLRQTSPGGFDENKDVLRNAARILRVFNFHRLTDYYGNVPYFNALQATSKVFAPTYDSQDAIYKDMLNELDQAGASLRALQPTTNRDDQAFINADLFYNGDITKWKKFAYSLMLRLAMRISNVDATTAGTYVQKAVAGGVFTSNADNLWVAMAEGPSQWTNQNGISRAFLSSDGGQPGTLSKTLIDELKGPIKNSVADDDPRLMIFSEGFGTHTNPLEQRGLPNGLDQTMVDAMEGKKGVNIAATFSQLNSKLIQVDDPYLLMSYSEVALLLADAGVRGIGGVSAANAETNYNAGVRAAMQMYTPFDPSFAVSDATVDAYLAARPFPADKDGRLEAIGTQLWLSKFMNWWDAWADWRRTGYPVLTPVNFPGNVTGGTIPRKLRIPNTEIATNQANYSEGATTPDTPVGRVWWDVAK